MDDLREPRHRPRDRVARPERQAVPGGELWDERDSGLVWVKCFSADDADFTDFSA